VIEVALVGVVKHLACFFPAGIRQIGCWMEAGKKGGFGPRGGANRSANRLERAMAEVCEKSVQIIISNTKYRVTVGTNFIVSSRLKRTEDGN
jgi:hypothetical protein